MAERTTPSKRKRQSSLASTIDNSTFEPTLDPPESPRSRVADNLCRMRLNDHDHDHYEPLSKKRGLTLISDGYGETPTTMRALATPPKDIKHLSSSSSLLNNNHHDMRDMLEINETPGAYMSFTNPLPSSPPISPSPSPPDLDSDDERPETTMTTTTSHTSSIMSHHYRSTSRTSAGRVRKTSLSQEMDSVSQSHSSLPNDHHRSRCFSFPAVKPITVAPPPTPLTSPSEKTAPAQQALFARILSIPTLPLAEDVSVSPLRISPTKKRRTSPPPPAYHEYLKTSARHQYSGSESSFSSSSSSSSGGDSSFPNAPPVGLSRSSHDAQTVQGANDKDKDKDSNEDSDDGEGVNGIGYRPTAAVEWKRKQGRRKQVLEWKAREANEDRRRRAERRKGRGSSGSNGRGGGGGGRFGEEFSSFGGVGGGVGVRGGGVEDGGLSGKGQEEGGTEGGGGGKRVRARVRFAD